ncbi:MAG: cadherin-like beta sandwich domain-containing protein, partial [Verrucomicrobia bacterium]|nr:cadherin-like beta sandwich domain-containing protein [Verrucomicrobiota bacterium]
TGVWVSTSNRGTNPTKSDTDADGLSDGAESNTGTFVSETNTGTNPLLRDTDGDLAEDWYEASAAYTNPTLATSKPNVPYPLPDPDTSTGTGTKPVKVFILSGQSNMVGFGRVAGTGSDTLQSVTQTEKKFPNLITSTNAWTVRQDVLYRGVISALGDAPLAPGFGESTDSFGPELGFGHVMGYLHGEPVLIIKTSIGNRALGYDFLPPGSVRYNYGGTTFAGYGDYDDFPQGGTAPVTGPWYAGKQYDDSFLDEQDMGAKAWVSGVAYTSGAHVKNGGNIYKSKIAHTSAAANAPGVGASWTTNWSVFNVTNVVDVLDNFATEYPQWATRGFEIAGFGWFHGWNDGQSNTTGHASRYQQNLAQLIKQLRLYYNGRYPGKIQPTAPFTVVTSGFDGFAATGNRLTVVNAQLAVGNGTTYPEFAGNVKSMEGRGYWRTTGPNTAQNYHYYHNAETYMLVGDAMGRGMAELLASSSTVSQLTALTLSSGTLTPVFAGDTFVYSATVASSSITVTPKLAGSSITVNGTAVASGAASAAIPLSIGANIITVASTLSGSTSTYTLTVTRTQNTYTWATDAAGPSSWSTTANWTPNTGFPNGIDDLALLTNNITADNQVSLAAPATVGGLDIGDASGDNAFAISGTGQSITFDVGTGSATLNRTATGLGTDTVSTAIILADPLNASVTTNTGSLALNGIISETGGARLLTKNGAGVLILGAANTHTGGTTLTNGTLTLTHASALGSGTLTFGNNTNNPYLNNGSGSAITTSINSVCAGNVRVGGTWNFNGNIALTASTTFEHYSTVTITGVISGGFSLTKNGVSTLVLNGLNTYTGQTVLRQGTVTINTLKNYGVPSSLGAPTVTTTNIVIAPNNSTNLNYTGTGDTTNRTIQVGGAGSAATTTSISNVGTGPLVFTAAAFNTPVGITTGSAQRSLNLAGSFGTTASPNEVQGVIADNTLNGATAPANRINVSKGGTNVWKFSGINTYSGTTTIGAGALILGANNVLPDSTAVSLGAGTLDAATRTDTAGTFDPTTVTSTINLGTGAALAFADSSAVDWTGGTLTITGTFVSGSSLRFGITATGLTATQLTQIVSAGFTSFSLNSSGYLIGSTAPTFTTWQTANPGAGAFTADHDNDGVANGIEFFLGGNSNTTGPTPLPAVVNTSGTLSITWTKSATYPGTYGTHFWIESTDTLTGTWTTETLGGNVIQTGNNITYAFPIATRRFVRLKVVGP